MTHDTDAAIQKRRERAALYVARALATKGHPGVRWAAISPKAQGRYLSTAWSSIEAYEQWMAKLSRDGA